MLVISQGVYFTQPQTRKWPVDEELLELELELEELDEEDELEFVLLEEDELEFVLLDGDEELEDEELDLLEELLLSIPTMKFSLIAQ